MALRLHYLPQFNQLYLMRGSYKNFNWNYSPNWTSSDAVKESCTNYWSHRGAATFTYLNTSRVGQSYTRVSKNALYIGALDRSEGNRYTAWANFESTNGGKRTSWSAIHMHTNQLHVSWRRPAVVSSRKTTVQSVDLVRILHWYPRGCWPQETSKKQSQHTRGAAARTKPKLGLPWQSHPLEQYLQKLTGTAQYKLLQPLTYAIGATMLHPQWAV